MENLKVITARYQGACGQCKKEIKVGDKICQPKTKNRAGGRLYVACWYCLDCGTWFAKSDLIWPPGARFESLEALEKAKQEIADLGPLPLPKE